MICEFNISSTADTESPPTLRSEIARIKKDLEFYEGAYLTASQACDTLQKRLNEVTQDRDEARRSVCKMSIQLGGVFRRVGGKTVEVTTPEGCAEIMRWDCFKEDTDER